MLQVSDEENNIGRPHFQIRNNEIMNHKPRTEIYSSYLEDTRVNSLAKNPYPYPLFFAGCS